MAYTVNMNSLRPTAEDVARDLETQIIKAEKARLIKRMTETKLEELEKQESLRVLKEREAFYAYVTSSPMSAPYPGETAFIKGAPGSPPIYPVPVTKTTAGISVGGHVWPAITTNTTNTVVENTPVDAGPDIYKAVAMGILSGDLEVQETTSKDGDVIRTVRISDKQVKAGNEAKEKLTREETARCWTLKVIKVNYE